MEYPPLKALFMITTQGIPDLREPEKWSPEFKHFIKICLDKDPAKRPSAKELLEVIKSFKRPHEANSSSHCSTLSYQSQLQIQKFCP
jgi:serine/threonine protein kinase